MEQGEEEERDGYQEKRDTGEGRLIAAPEDMGKEYVEDQKEKEEQEEEQEGQEEKRDCGG